MQGWSQRSGPENRENGTFDEVGRIQVQGKTPVFERRRRKACRLMGPKKNLSQKGAHEVKGNGRGMNDKRVGVVRKQCWVALGEGAVES